MGRIEAHDRFWSKGARFLAGSPEGKLFSMGMASPSVGYLCR